jgi:hypothetical protein
MVLDSVKELSCISLKDCWATHQLEEEQVANADL